jgi:alkylated DNA repair protein alkB family protein 1
MTRRRIPSTSSQVPVNENDSKFKATERLYKNRERVLDISRAFDCDAIVWSDTSDQGVWRCPTTSREVHCRKIKMLNEFESSSELDKKNKGVDRGTTPQQLRFIITIPAIPGLVLVPAILSRALQREIVKVSLRSSVLPNLTSLSAHYDLPQEGIWRKHELGRGEEPVDTIELDAAIKARGSCDSSSFPHPRCVSSYLLRCTKFDTIRSLIVIN